MGISTLVPVAFAKPMDPVGGNWPNVKLFHPALAALRSVEPCRLNLPRTQAILTALETILDSRHITSALVTALADAVMSGSLVLLDAFPIYKILIPSIALLILATRRDFRNRALIATLNSLKNARKTIAEAAIVVTTI